MAPVSSHDEAFERFYAAEFDGVFRAAYVFCGDRDEAAEAAQEAFVRAYDRWERLRRESWAAGWAVTTALNLTRRGLRRRRRLRMLVAEGAAPVSHDAPSLDRVTVAAALRELGHRQRTAVVLYYLVDLPVPAVAALMRCSEGTVKAHLSQSRTRLKSIMEAPRVR